MLEEDTQDVHEFKTKVITDGELLHLVKLRAAIEKVEAKKLIEQLKHTVLNYQFRDALRSNEEEQLSLVKDRAGLVAKMKNVTSMIGDKYEVGDDWTYDDETGALTQL